MNLREVQLSSRSVIPVALALPINREPADIQRHTERMQVRRDAVSNGAGQEARTISFYL